MLLFTMTISLFFIMDSVGNITDFLNLIRVLPAERQRRIILREMFIALAIMISFKYFGVVLLSYLEVGPATVQIAGGLVLFMISINMVFTNKERLFVSTDNSEPFIVPIGTPMIAGPSVLATIMFYAFTEKTPFKVELAIVLAWFLTVVVLWLAYHYRQRVSQKILMALEKLMGLILILMSVEMFLKGLRVFIAQTKL